MRLQAVVLRAAAALPHDDRERAVAALRTQLCVMADSVGGTPDWASLAVTGPREMPGAQDGARFEWTASVVVHGESVLDCLADPDEEVLPHVAP
jgi:hypothetical protein